MGRWGIGVLLLLPAACDEAPPPATLREVPAQFIGAWDSSVGDCGRSGPNAVSIAADRLVLEKATVDVTGVAPDGDNAARVDGHFSGPGASWDGSVRLELSDGGRVLSVVDGTTVIPRVKCP